MAGHDITWGDSHHPALSETDGDYDGQFLFINDKANPRIAVIDLRDFETKQIVTNPNMGTNHGGTFVTPNTEYVIEGAQYSGVVNSLDPDLSLLGPVGVSIVERLGSRGTTGLALLMLLLWTVVPGIAGLALFKKAR